MILLTRIFQKCLGSLWFNAILRGWSAYFMPCSHSRTSPLHRLYPPGRGTERCPGRSCRHMKRKTPKWRLRFGS